MTHNNPEERSVEELLEKNAEYIENVSFGQYNDKGVNIGYKTLTQLIVEAHHHQLQKARDEERERVTKLWNDHVEKYRPNDETWADEFAYKLNQSNRYQADPLPTQVTE